MTKKLVKYLLVFVLNFKKFFSFEDKTSDSRNTQAIAREEKYDGVFVLLSSQENITPDTVVKSYKNLRIVPTLFDDFKNFVDIRPIRHRLSVRVRGHVLICILALLLKRIFEIYCLNSKSTTQAVRRD